MLAQVWFVAQACLVERRRSRSSLRRRGDDRSETMSHDTMLRQFTIQEPAPGYWRIVFSNPPINLLNSTTVFEIGEIVRWIAEAPDLRVVVFASDHPDFYMARYDLSDTNPIAFAPTASGATAFIDSTVRLSSATPITIASIRGRARGGGSE